MRGALKRQTLIPQFVGVKYKNPGRKNKKQQLRKILSVLYSPNFVFEEIGKREKQNDVRKYFFCFVGTKPPPVFSFFGKNRLIVKPTKNFFLLSSVFRRLHLNFQKTKKIQIHFEDQEKTRFFLIDWERKNFLFLGVIKKYF